MTLRRFFKILLGKDFYTKVQYKCHTETYGNPGASFTINPNLINKNSIFYSFGIGSDISFDLSIIEKYGINIYAFDPTPRSLKWLKKQELPKEFKHYDFGLASFDGTASFYSPNNPDHVSFSMKQSSFVSSETVEVNVYQLKTVLEKLKHNKIDVLKMDIEGAEYDVINNIINSGIEIKQLLVEFHHRLVEDGITKTKITLKELNEAGYKIFYISKSGEEFSFLKL